MIDILDVLLELLKTFFFSGWAGLLGFLLMWIILLAPYHAGYRFGRLGLYMGANRFILICCLLALVGSAWLAHWALDAFSIWYTSPLDPPLRIIQ